MATNQVKDIVNSRMSNFGIVFIDIQVYERACAIAQNHITLLNRGFSNVRNMLDEIDDVLKEEKL